MNDLLDNQVVTNNLLIQILGGRFPVPKPVDDNKKGEKGNRGDVDDDQPPSGASANPTSAARDTGLVQVKLLLA